MLSQFQLKNGLKVFLYQSQRSPVVSVQAWVKTGSADESKKEQGISHFIEHLVFKGTKSYGPGEIAQVVEGSGGELNAYTSFDQTVFYVTISKHSSDIALQTISEMMGTPRFDSEEVDKEREVVIEEIRRGKDSLGRRASQLMLTSSYGKHPYGIPVIGFEENIKKWKISDIKNYFKERYSAKNMFLVVTGDFEKQQIKKKIIELFSEIPTSKVRKIKRAPYIKNKKTKVTFEKSSFQQAVTYVSFPIPEENHKDIPALEILSLVLGQGEGSRLVKKLCLEDQIASSVGSSLFSARDPGLFLISLAYEDDKFESCIKAILSEVNKIKAQHITRAELDRALINLVSEPLFSKETVDGLSQNIGAGVFRKADPNFQEKYSKAMLKVNTTDILRVAKKYLNLEAAVVSDFSQRDKSGAVKKIIKSSTKELIKVQVPPSKTSIKNLQVTLRQQKPQLESWRTDSGVEVLFYPSTETSMVSVRCALLGGVRALPKSEVGLTELASRVWLSGAGNKSEHEINELIEGTASSISAVSGKNTTGLNGEFLKPFASKMADLYWEILTQPHFSDKIITRERDQMYIQLKQRDDNPSQVAFLNFQNAIFDGHPYSNDLLGNRQNLESLNSQTLMKHHKKIFNRANFKMMISGNFDIQEWKARINKWSQELLAGESCLKPIQLSTIDKDREIFIASEKEQSHLIIGFRGPDLQSKDRETLEVMQALLAGQGGRLFLELRDKNSLAYSVSPIKFDGYDAGYFGGYIGCAPDKVPLARKMMKEEFEKLGNKLVAEDELQRAKVSIIGSHDISIQKVSSQAQAIFYEEIYTKKGKQALEISEAINRVTSKDIKDLAERIFSQKSVTVLVGPKNSL